MVIILPSKFIAKKEQQKAPNHHFLFSGLKREVYLLMFLNWKMTMTQLSFFAWEPKGHRFAVIHGDNTRPDISFYSAKKIANTGKILKLRTLRSKQANTLHWSPAGRFIVFAGLNDFAGKIEFYDADEFKTSAMVEHYLATGIQWDPTGR
ncbi:hypothetical protein ACH5RR_040429 [Cinchona calisaya]|uniref:Translation initiation factor beta propellor-like domain-containing protein n=1 Tax=Cinchona calisaya TaxID=153742 RepID=A0ABD2XRT2_9GENT